MSTETRIEINADLPEHRMAVVVFTTVRAVDRLDASHLAEDAVALALGHAEQVQQGRTEIRGELMMSRDRIDVSLRIPVQVAAIRELGIACGDGYLWVEPTSKAYR